MGRLIIWCLVLFVFGLESELHAQKEGDTWIIGYSANEELDSNFSLMSLKFGDGELRILYDFTPRSIFMSETSATICDGNGDPIIWTNGMEIRGSNAQHIADTIARDGDIWSYWEFNHSNVQNVSHGYRYPSAAFILPSPGKDSMYSVIYHNAERNSNLSVYQVTRWLEAKIRANSNDSFELLYKDSLIAPYLKWYHSSINAVRHANGRDWWLISFEANTDQYFKLLYSSTGIHYLGKYSIDHTVISGLGQSVISPKGNYLARLDASFLNDDMVVTLLGLDRCSGSLTFINQISIPTGTYSGLAFSPSERFLYADGGNATKLWQWDLWAEDIPGSQMLVDTFDGFVQPGWFATGFGPMLQAPDGRIYIAPTSGSSNFMHVIDRPDLPASECGFKQHSINLLRPSARTAPNIPNFRLGPIDGSPCDTLDINNLPKSKWRYEPDPLSDPSTIRFTDLSYFDPDTWSWDFGDNSSSDQPSPVHAFEPGYYKVCQTVSNQYDSDSTCKWIEMLPTGIEEEYTRAAPEITIDPNPFDNYLSIKTKSDHFQTVDISIYDMFGRRVLSRSQIIIPSALHLPEMAAGIYLVTVVNMNGQMYTAKLLHP